MKNAQADSRSSILGHLERPVCRTGLSSDGLLGPVSPVVGRSRNGATPAPGRAGHRGYLTHTDFTFTNSRRPKAASSRP